MEGKWDSQPSLPPFPSQRFLPPLKSQDDCPRPLMVPFPAIKTESIPFFPGLALLLPLLSHLPHHPCWLSHVLPQISLPLPLVASSARLLLVWSIACQQK
jgi:hypothetical protein